MAGTTAATADPYAAFADPVPSASATNTHTAGDPYAAIADPVGAPHPAAPPETLGRVAGLAGRALMTGAGQLADLPGHLIAGTDLLGKTVADAVRHFVGLGSSMPAAQIGSPVTAAATHGADAVGLPTPATPAERIGSAAVSAAPSALLAPEAPLTSALWSAAGGAASQGVAEGGGGRAAQLAAGLGVGGLPALGAGAAGLARTLTRGAGEANAAAAAGRLANAADAGVNLTAGQATGSHLLQMAEGASSKFWGGGAIKEAAQEQTAGLGERVDGIVRNLSGDVTPTPTAAGEAINKGAAAAKQNMRAAEKAAYDDVDALVHPATPIDVSQSVGRAAGLVTPTANDELNSLLVSPKLAGFHKVLSESGGQLPYGDLAQLRTAVGKEITPLATDSSNGAFKQLYGQLTDDMNAAAAAVSPEAASAVKQASSLYKANSARRDFLDSIVDKAGGPEAVYAAATNGTKLGATKVAGVMGALAPEQQNVVRATVLDRLGRSIPSKQNASGDAFSAETFLTNWNKLAPEAKNALFGVSGGPPNTLRRSLDALAGTASTVRKSTIYPNPSGTGEAMGHSFGLLTLLEGIGAALAGHPAHLAAVGGGFALNAALSRALVNPKTAAWLATTTKLPPSAVPAAVAQLGRLGVTDPDAAALAAALQQKQ